MGATVYPCALFICILYTMFFIMSIQKKGIRKSDTLKLFTYKLSTSESRLAVPYRVSTRSVRKREMDSKGLWSRLSARSVLLLRRGVHWTPAPFGGVKRQSLLQSPETVSLVPHLNTSCTGQWSLPSTSARIAESSTRSIRRFDTTK